MRFLVLYVSCTQICKTIHTQVCLLVSNVCCVCFLCCRDDDPRRYAFVKLQKASVRQPDVRARSFKCVWLTRPAVMSMFEWRCELEIQRVGGSGVGEDETAFGKRDESRMSTLQYS